MGSSQIHNWSWTAAFLTPSRSPPRVRGLTPQWPSKGLENSTQSMEGGSSQDELWAIGDELRGWIPPPSFLGSFEAHFSYEVCCKAVAMWLYITSHCFPSFPTSSLFSFTLAALEFYLRVKVQHSISCQRLCSLGNSSSLAPGSALPASVNIEQEDRWIICRCCRGGGQE